MRTRDVIEDLFAGALAGALPTSVVRRGRADLGHVFAAAGFQYGAEVGVWKGGFSESLCARVPGLRLLCVDPYESYPGYEQHKNIPERLAKAHAQARGTLARFDCTFVRLHSVEASRTVADRSLDFVYIDGNHGADYVRADLEAWLPKIRAGGILAGHDFLDMPLKPFVQVKPTVEAFVRERRIDPWYLLVGDKTPSYFWVVT